MVRVVPFTSGMPLGARAALWRRGPLSYYRSFLKKRGDRKRFEVFFQRYVAKNPQVLEALPFDLGKELSQLDKINRDGVKADGNDFSKVPAAQAFAARVAHMKKLQNQTDEVPIGFNHATPDALLSRKQRFWRRLIEILYY
jgi:hypothetical protein